MNELKKSEKDISKMLAIMFRPQCVNAVMDVMYGEYIMLTHWPLGDLNVILKM